MNCLYSPEVRAQNLQNKRLERQLLLYKRRYNKQIKLLLLGVRGSGRSTFIRQMRYAYNNGYTMDDRIKYIGIIHQNIFKGMQIMIEAMTVLEIPYESKENATLNAALIKNVDLNYAVLFIHVYFWALKELWADAGIQECCLRGREYNQFESTKYFFNHLDRIAAPYYIPSEQDILCVHEPSHGIIEHIFKYKNVEFRITDVGSQRSSYKKWIHCFDNVTAIIFMVAISEYGEFVLDSNQSNLFQESLVLFRKITCYKFFERIPIILVFNKMDVLEEKIMYSHLVDYFPEFTGPKFDPLSARTFIANMFLREIQKKRRSYHYFQNSTDVFSKSIIFIYTAVRDIILNSNLYNFNLI